MKRIIPMVKKKKEAEEKGDKKKKVDIKKVKTIKRMI